MLMPFPLKCLAHLMLGVNKHLQTLTKIGITWWTPNICPKLFWEAFLAVKFDISSGSFGYTGSSGFDATALLNPYCLLPISMSNKSNPCPIVILFRLATTASSADGGARFSTRNVISGEAIGHSRGRQGSEMLAIAGVRRPVEGLGHGGGGS